MSIADELTNDEIQAYLDRVDTTIDANPYDPVTARAAAGRFSALVDALQYIVKLTECDCGPEWLQFGRHAPECAWYISELANVALTSNRPICSLK